MKKFTLLLVLLLAVVGVKADTGKCVIDLAQFTTSDGEKTTYTPASKEMVTTVGWNGGIQWWPSYRWVATKFVVKTSSEAKLKIVVYYDDETYTQSLPGTGATTFEVATNPNKVIKGFSIQDQQASTVTFSEAYLESPGAIALTNFAKKENASTWEPSTGELVLTSNWSDAIQYWPGSESDLSGSKLVIYSSENADFKAIVSYVGGGDADNGSVSKHSLTLDSSKKIQGITYQGTTTGTFHITGICLIPQTVFLDEYSSTSLSSVSNVDVVMNREMKAGWNSICLPFATTASALGCTAYKFASATTSSVTFSEVTELAAGTPYLANFTTAKSNLSFENVSITATSPGSVEKNGVTFQGTYAHIDGKDKFGVLTNGSIMKGAEGAYFDGYRAYFTGGLSAEARVLLLDEETTGINNVTVKAENNDVYTLAGAKVIGQPQRGIYIKNGKKFIVK